MDGPGFVKQIERPDDTTELTAGQVRLRFKVAGLCGSDMPRLNGILVVPNPNIDYIGSPVHEIVAEVIESASDQLRVGQRVVGSGGGNAGMCEIFVGSDQMVIPVPDELGDVEAITVQSLGTVIRAANQFPDVTGRRVAVIGAGPIGLSFCHVLKHRGAAHVSAIDPIERESTARHFGADEFFHLRSSEWLDALDPKDAPEIVVEAVGHQHPTIADALQAVAERGYVYGFGSPDDPNYVLPYKRIYEKGITLAAGRTPGDWPTVLKDGLDHLLAYRDDFADYVSHAVPVTDAQRAYSLYARPQAGRLKVAIAASR